MNSSEPCYYEESKMAPILGTVLWAEFALGLVGNSAVLCIFCFYVHSWNISTLYLFNVTFADFLLIVCLPFRAEYFLCGKNWHFGDIPCRIMLFMMSLNRTGSISFLTAVVVNRYFMIVHPHLRINMINTIPTGLAVTSCIWALIILLTIYILLTSHLITGEIANTTLCESFNLNWGESVIIIWHYVFFVIQLVIPLLIIILCTGCIIRHLRKCKDERGKIQRAIRSVTFVAFVFIVCFLPSTVSTIMVVISKHLAVCKLFDVSSLVFSASLALTYFNSVLNPLAIYISSPPLQKAIHNAYNCTKKKNGSRSSNTSMHYVT